MQVYLPIAEMSVNALLVLGMGGLVGFLSGMFGVGGGFLMTPLLIFIGVPPAIAVGTQANQLVAASVSGVLAHWRRGNVDVKLGVVMLLGGMVGTVVGVWIFSILQRIGQIDAAITLSYVFFLGTIGTMMMVEASRALIRRRAPTAKRGKLHRHMWLHGLPLKMRFQRSKLYISALLPAGIGAVGGMLVAIMGIGGGFMLVPAMIYLLNMPTGLVAGTSLFQIIFTTAMATLLQAATNQTVDVMLALLLLIGGVVGAQFGTKAGGRLRGEQARLLLASLVVAVALKLAFDLVMEPNDVFTISTRMS
ncbi:sulfite exporter TauE/SafE family protein [Azospirillum brasilense]|uniref:Probable membrane transporter protein n=1 Tax=Azospirillum brasilense TaxID=192 RepID=A0A0P0EUF7_AZOBR|nr:MULTISPECIES: sulfite exporter TauE/SafE family protein [Azospirillum]ALJ34039.1 permease [Azospirillum brasilense]MDW7552994.1 sulfite exporter TauE/SafE family protein [Azospirillum brasilense]MDW7591814.1 sulfite exporter TauE/SafE family protein [Azospirillum brasilense]MDW7627909.1 sulfite exporter TauE/SafE family protein [Azospirillum brasilense]MDX5952622.1 sulfite exporter TauE/SafE family protein [Azospirillum brasilense]